MEHGGGSSRRLVDYLLFATGFRLLHHLMYRHGVRSHRRADRREERRARREATVRKVRAHRWSTWLTAVAALLVAIAFLAGGWLLLLIGLGIAAVVGWFLPQDKGSTESSGVEPRHTVYARRKYYDELSEPWQPEPARRPRRFGSVGWYTGAVRSKVGRSHGRG